MGETSEGRAGIDCVRNQIILEVIGPQGLRFLPYLVTLFFFVFFTTCSRSSR